MVEGSLIVIDHKIIWYFKQLLRLLWCLLVIMKQSYYGNREDCPMKALSFTTSGSWIRHLKTTVEFSGGCLKQGKGNFTHTNEANLCIACELDTW